MPEVQNSRFSFTVPVLTTVLLLLLLPLNLSRSSSSTSLAVLSDKENMVLNRLFYPDLVNRFDSIMKTFVNTRNFNGNVLIAINHSVVYTASFGYADMLSKVPLSLNTAFQLASVSKQFTAMAILLLHQEKKLSIDDYLQQYIPELPYPNVTIRHLLNHTAGLPNYMSYIELEWNKPKLPDNEDMIGVLCKAGVSTMFAPGSRFSYSNTGYAVLASVVERVSQMPFSQFLHKRFFQPLGMFNTFTSAELIDNQRIAAPISSGHRRLRKGFVRTDITINDRILGDKGVYSTVNDLFKWDKALYLGKLIQPSLLEQAYFPAKLRSKKSVSYGFGFRIELSDQGKIVYHHGLWEGFRNSFYRYIEKGNTIIILNNLNQGFNSEIIHELEKIMDQPNQVSPVQPVILEYLSTESEQCIRQWEQLQREGIVKPADQKSLLQSAWQLAGMGRYHLSARLLRFYDKTATFFENMP